MDRMSQYNLPSVYQFLLHTPEQGLRKILVEPKGLTDIHFSLLIKIVRNCPEATFCDHFDKGTFPKIKMSPNETKLKEKFWQDLTQTLNQRGLLNPADKAA